RDRIALRQVLRDRALVGVRVGDVQVVRLGPGGGDVVAELVVGGGRGAGDRVEVVADPDQLGDVLGEPVEAGHHLRVELDGGRLPGDVGALGVGHVPVRSLVDPGVE